MAKRPFIFSGLEGKLSIPEGVTEIEESAFYRCKNLTEVVIPKSVKRLGKWIFHGCSRLKYLTILHDVDFIGDWIINKNDTVIRCIKGSNVDDYCQAREFRTDYGSV